MVRIESRLKTFRQSMVLEQLSDSDWKVVRGDQDLSDQANEWCQEIGVQPFFVSPPAITVIGKDANGHLHMISSISILYNSEQEVEDVEPKPDSSAGAPGAEPLATIIKRLQGAVELDHGQFGANAGGEKNSQAGRASAACRKSSP